MPKYSLQRKRDRIAELIKRLKNDNDVQARDINLVLTAAQRKEMRKEWKDQLNLRKDDKPAEVLEYEAMLQKALMLNGRYEKLCREKPQTAKAQAKWRERRQALGTKQEGMFEDALGRLEEIITASPGLQIWFDRGIDFGGGSNFDANPTQVPRVLTSRSVSNLADKNWKEKFGIKTKTEHKIDVLDRALAELDKQLMTDEEKRADAAQQAAKSTKLKTMLAKLKKQSDI